MHFTHSLRSVLTFAAMLSGALSARDAQACAGMWSSALCDPQCAPGNDICQFVGTDTWECDLARCGDTTSADAVVVSNYSADDYDAWGTDARGVDFCCQVTNSAIRKVVLLGGSYNDELRLWFQTSPSTEYDLDTHAATVPVQGRVSGRSGDDTIEGSRTLSNDYSDHLFGDSGADIIWGQDGDDEIRGNADNDDLDGGLDNDTMYGDGGADTMIGGDGGDTMYGNDGNDDMSGGAGDDVMRGDDGDDEMCGGAHSTSDNLQGLSGNDNLWGNTSGDVLNCGGGGSDYSDSTSSSITGCTTTLTVIPAGCP